MVFRFFYYIPLPTRFQVIFNFIFAISILFSCILALF
ncbi:hypothetical protein RUMGNA_03473 [Mediterraneibacter gnavus ATCC 29149]|uniref:Uncharacterized protein n=1 Tax=Mediterraneibacter gnavus (strain ATCC 29149 / DSM 114966 / JCM 6515 / VPI C7-9) TaxID=411470 RepID=A7B7A7_MEDG7|nr:hypothetical protein RUMGNA_03473 [Mediterraneibacter gnavus ATCC 29149]